MDARTESEWLNRVADLLATPRTGLPHAELATALNETFDLVGCSFNDQTPGPGVLRANVRRGAETERIRKFVDRGPGAPEHVHPLLVYYASTRADRPMQIADLPPPFDRPSLLGPWRDFARPGGFDQVVVLPLHRHHRAFAMARSTVFRPAEIESAGLLWRLIRGLDRQFGALAETRCDPDVARAVLTPRETAVFGLVAEGRTAAAVARRLGIAERTVHKHLQRVYRKLGVSDRLSAVLRAQRIGLLRSAQYATPDPADAADVAAPYPHDDDTEHLAVPGPGRLPGIRPR